jgi:hypothetical protein
MNINPKLLPTVLIIIDLLSALCYLPSKDWRHVIYWIAAGTLTAVVTY